LKFKDIYWPKYSMVVKCVMEQNSTLYFLWNWNNKNWDTALYRYLQFVLRDSCVKCWFWVYPVRIGGDTYNTCDTCYTYNTWEKIIAWL